MEDTTLDFHCGGCGRELSAPMEFARQTHPCPYCKTPTTAPDSSTRSTNFRRTGVSSDSRVPKVRIDKAALSRSSSPNAATTEAATNTTNEDVQTLPEPQRFDATAVASHANKSRKSLNSNLLPKLAQREELDFWNPESQDWQQRASENAVPHWLIPIAIGAMVLVVVSLGLYFRQAPAPETTGMQPPPLANLWRERCETTVRSFLEAESIGEKLQWVRHPLQTRPRMVEYLLREPEPWQLDTFRKKTTATSMDGTEFLLFDVQLAHGITRTAALELTPSGALLDWESFVLYEEVPWQDYIAERPSRAHVFRVHCAEDDYYNFSFGNEETHMCLRIDSPTRNQQIYGYVVRNSEPARSIQRLLKRSVESGNEWTKLTLQLRFVPESGAQQVAVEALVSEFWVFDMDREAKPANPFVPEGL